MSASDGKKVSLDKLTDEEISVRLSGLNGWRLDRGALHKEFRFTDFVKAFSFMTAVAMAAEKMNHHPEWSNAYSRVSVWLSTHDVAGLTDDDFILAEKMNQLAGEFTR